MKGRHMLGKCLSGLPSSAPDLGVLEDGAISIAKPMGPLRSRTLPYQNHCGLRNAERGKNHLPQHVQSIFREAVKSASAFGVACKGD